MSEFDAGTEGEAADLPLKPERLQAIHSRFWIHLAQERVLPYPGIQYILSEIGPGLQRLDPRELEVALHILTTAASGTYSVAEPLPGIFVAADARGGHAEHQATLAAATKQDQFDALVAEMGDDRGTVAAKQIRSVLSSENEVETVDATRSEPLGGRSRWPAGGGRFSVPTEERRASIWVTSNLRWLLPDDPCLWKHLAYCVETGQRPLMIARKIAVSTFPLLKAMGAFGVQLHHLYTPGAPRSQLAARALAAGPLIRDAREIREHVAVREWVPAYLAAPPAEPSGNADAVRLACRLGLDRDDLDERSRVLRTWADQCSLILPARWKAQITRYVRWDKTTRDQLK